MQLSIAFINDVHGYLEPHPELFYKGDKEIIATAGGFANIASIIKDIRNKSSHILLFDGGDSFHGTLPLIQSKGEVLVPILNKMGFNAMVAHWDFAYGPPQLKNIASKLNYPILGINVYNEDNSLFLPPYIILEVKDLKIAVIGICCNIIDKTMPKHFSEGINITDASNELPVYIKKVKEEGADLIILLSHNGFPQDMALLSLTDGIDICLSAHTHNRLYEAVKINNTAIIQCGCHGSFVGHIELDIQEKKIADFKYKLINVDQTVKPDEEIEEMVVEIMKRFQSLKQEVVGSTPVILHRYNALESTMDNLLLSAIKKLTNADVAFSNGWRYGVPIPIGSITKWDLFNMIPMNPEVSAVQLTGWEIIQMLEENLERTFAVNPMMQMGGYVKRCLGVQVKMKIENPPGHRIQEIFIAGEPLMKLKTYDAAFVTIQGVPEKFGKNRRSLPIHAVDAMVEYLAQSPNFDGGCHNSFSLV